MALGYIPQWRSPVEVFSHIQSLGGGTREDAWLALRPALREGKVKSRRIGVRYSTFRHDGIPPGEWHSARLDLVTGAMILPDGCRYAIEICWKDVLPYWPEPDPQPLAKPPRPTAAVLDGWMHENVQRGMKRADAIKACVKATGATHREAAKAWGRLPDKFKLKRGQRASLRKKEQ